MLKYAVLFLSLMFASTALVMCDDDDGPAEQAGEEIDNAVEDLTGD